MDLARDIVRDGEGATKLVEILVQGAANEAEAKNVAYTIAHSPLVKTALFASDPNWGRILAAVGRAGISGFEIDRVEIWLDDICIVRDGGRAPDYTEQAGASVVSRDEFTIRVTLGRGDAQTRILSCDLSYDYVKINAEYRT
jgi:glutamate N-acetyltransferase/amino-acid N-acetyltransferase